VYFEQAAISGEEKISGEIDIRVSMLALLEGMMGLSYD
jgi:hypothetical protein